MSTRKFLAMILSCAALLCLAMPVNAEMLTGNFAAILDSQANLTTPFPDPNDGWADGTGQRWFLYGAEGVAIQQQDWWNQWWYDHPLDFSRRKTVRLFFDYEFTSASGVLFGTINWSDEFWSQSGPDGAPPLPGEGHVLRLSDFGFEPLIIESNPDIVNQVFQYDSGYIPLPVLYNPEWVSVDVWGSDVIITSGILEHECHAVPIPQAIWLLGSGLFGLFGLRRRFT